MIKNESYVFCEGVGCPLKEQCHRYVDSLGVDHTAVGYVWIAACDNKEKNGYQPISPNR